jgi:NAD(P)-dependent dehydrogenase (short-subunit alcohol dehydrogenase family)
MASQVVVITGASAGVGRAVAREVADRGARVALLARGETGLAAAAEEVERRGGKALTVPVDVADAAAVEAAADQIERVLGPIDIWINAAFTGVFARFGEVRPDEYERATAVTYFGCVNGTRAALARMQPRGRGTIVQVGSALAYRGIPLQSAYCGAKHAIKGFTESLRTELLHDQVGVNVTMVHLPGMNTPQFSWLLSRLPKRAQPVPPIYQPEVAARVVAYAAEHPRRREYWVGGSTVATLLGNRVAPGVLDRYLARTGVASQQTDESADPAAPVNLWQPADGPDGKDFGAHGEFDEQSVQTALQPWLSRHRAAVALTTVAGFAGLFGGLIRFRGGEKSRQRHARRSRPRGTRSAG